MVKTLAVLGGGYGGLAAVGRLLELGLPDDVRILLIDRLPFHGLKTEFYALAAGTVAEYDIRVAFPDHPQVEKRYGEVTEVRPAEGEVHLAGQEPVKYDWLILALGCVDKYHNIPGAEQHTLSVQTLSACRKTYQVLNDLSPYKQVTIVGGGLSGVEIAAELRESRADLNIRILDRGESILSPYPEKLRKYVRDWFVKHDIEMVPYVSVSRVEPDAVYGGDVVFPSDAVVWTAGIQPSPVVQKLDVPKDHSGRVAVNELYQIPGYENVFVIGDCAASRFSPSAQAAEAQGKRAAEALVALWQGKTPQISDIKLKGVLGSLGKKAGFGVMGKRTVMLGKVPRALKSGVLWLSKHHFG